MDENKVYDMIKGPMSDLLATHLAIGSDSMFGATICHMITLYCEFMRDEKGRTDIDSVTFSSVLAQTMMEEKDDKVN